MGFAPNTSSNKDEGHYVPYLPADEDGARAVAERKLDSSRLNWIRRIRGRYDGRSGPTAGRRPRGDPDRRCDQGRGTLRVCRRNPALCTEGVAGVPEDAVRVCLPDRKLVHLAAERAMDPQRFRPRRAEASTSVVDAGGRALLGSWAGVTQRGHDTLPKDQQAGGRPASVTDAWRAEPLPVMGRRGASRRLVCSILDTST